MSAAMPLPNESSRRKSNELLLAGGLLFAARADEYADHAVVPLVTGRIEDHVLLIRRTTHVDLNRPRLGPGFGIFEGNLAAQVVGVHARDVFDHFVGFGVRAAETLQE